MSIDRLIEFSLNSQVMKSLRSAWMLSKHYNTDTNIIGLLDKITLILLTRVRSFVRLDRLRDPAEAAEAARSSLLLLSEWEGSFHATRCTSIDR